jgi:two-component system response regulator HydG
MSDSKTTNHRILVVDDEPGARTALTELLREEGYEVRAAADGYKALGRLDGWQPDVLITDLKMPGMDGIELMEKIRQRLPHLPVVVMTAFGSVESAVDAIHQGANDYLTKPLHLGQLLVVIQRVLQHRDLQQEAERMRDALARQGDGGTTEQLIGRSKPFRDLMSLAEQVADSNAAILIDGEAGTGKKVIARALHDWSPRKEGPFVVLNCSGLDESAVERELFGYEEGAFVGAQTAWRGRLEQANGGTLFLDEIATLPAAVQVKLLQFFQDQTFERVGGKESVSVDVRIVSATTKDLHGEVDGGRFREDLFYRLNVISLRMPTLRERREDIPLLSTHFLEKYSRSNHKTVLGFNERALGVLLNFDWPGNIRQLENCIERAVVLCRGQEIEPRDLPRELMQGMRPTDQLPQIPGATLRELERFAILKTLEHVGGSTSKAARILGISPRKIQYRLNEYRDEDPGSVTTLHTATA